MDKEKRPRPTVFVRPPSSKTRSASQQQAAKPDKAVRDRQRFFEETYDAWACDCEYALAFMEENRDVARAFKETVGLSRDFQLCVRKAMYLAGSDRPVHIYGETGTGKEGFAKAIHRLSPRGRDDDNDEGFHPFNCATALGDNMQISMLFGHKKGAFTGADHNRDGLFLKANGGTIFLDELAHLRPATQAILNRAAEPGSGIMGEPICRFAPLGSDKEKESNVRIVSAFNEPLLLPHYIFSRHIVPTKSFWRQYFVHQVDPTRGSPPDLTDLGNVPSRQGSETSSLRIPPRRATA